MDSFVLEALSPGYRQRLVTHLRETGALTSRRVEDAFLTIPRHRFLREGFFERVKEGWQQCSPDTLTEEDWLAAVYQDEAHITQMNKLGQATSSSSQPWIMAAMLEALHVEPGQHVLEIGTGTGYNAALLAHLVGDPGLVTTIDVDPVLARKAQEVLNTIVPGVVVIVGDGRDDFLHRTYDRIIATASSPSVPHAWLKRLSPEGRLICVLQPQASMRGALLKIDQRDGSYQGQLLRRAGFMELRHANNVSLPQAKVVDLLTRPVVETMQLSQTLASLPMCLKEDAFPFFVQYALSEAFPGICILPWETSAQARCTLISHPGSGTVLSVLEDDVPAPSVALRGGSAHLLWEHLQQAYGKWREIGRPGILQYRWTYVSEEQRLFAGELADAPNWHIA